MNPESCEDEVNMNNSSYDQLFDLYQRNVKICIWGCGYIAKTTCKDLLEKLSIKPYCYSDNNPDLWGSEVLDGCYCVDYKSLFHEKDMVAWIVAVSIADCDEVEKQIRSMGFQYVFDLKEIMQDRRILEKYFPFMKKKTVAYTCITGDYDDLVLPEDDLLEYYDFYVISDKHPKDNRGYKWISVNDVVPKEITDPTRMNRFCKINAHMLFPQYDRSIYFDGNITLKKNMDSFFDKLTDLKIGVIGENGMGSLYREGARLMTQNRENTRMIYKQIESYWKDGMPDEFGSWFCSILLREHNNLKCKEIMENWWEELCKWSRRDQISFPYVLWKNGYSKEDVLVLEEEFSRYFECDYWHWEKKHKVIRLA